jgi:flagellin
MALNSINTNTGAMIALQTLDSTSSELQQAQNEVSTGLKVGSAKDNGAVWAIAQNQRSQVTALDSVVDSLNRASSTIDVAMSAGSTISDLLNQMKAKALSASDTSLDTTSRAALNAGFVSLRDQISKVVSNADFNGVNMIKSGGTTVYALANADGSSRLTVAAEDLSLGGGVITVGATATLGTASHASSVLAMVNASITALNNAVAQLGTGSNSIQTTLTFVQNMQNTLTTGVGNLVDADVAAESATLQALQTKQQLGVQALSIANSSTNVLLSLFKG